MRKWSNEKWADDPGRAGRPPDRLCGADWNCRGRAAGDPVGAAHCNQILRSSTSPTPNYSEGCAAESRRDFAHKLSVSLKELRETKTWFRIIRKADLLPGERLHKITDETDQLCAILSQSVHTVKEEVRG